MRTDILLRAFFQALRAERLAVGIRDIGRMWTLFAAPRDWTLPAIQHSLRAAGFGQADDFWELTGGVGQAESLVSELARVRRVVGYLIG